ncbi:hypothetical protein T08_2151, partial [Trichinella sp. T8]
MRAMHVQVSDVHDGLKSALFEAFGVGTASERFSAEFYRRKEQRSESVRVYAGHLRWLFPKAFRGLSGAADMILLQQFKAGLSVNAVKTAVLRSRTDSFAKAIEVAAGDERARVPSVKADADQEDLQPAVEISEARAATVTTRKEVGEELAEVVRQLKHLLMTDIPAVAKRAPPQQRRRWEKKDRRTCWACGKTVHISRDCRASPYPPDDRTSKVSSTARTFPVVVIRSPEIETPTVEGSVGGVRYNMLVDTCSPLTLANEKFMWGSKTLWDVPKPAIQLESPSGGELQITACADRATLGQPRLMKAMKTTATAERVTTTTALKAKIEPRLNSCAVCNGEHIIFQCDQFLRATPDERWSLCSKRGLCFHCLYKGHLANRCSRRKPCGEAGCTLKHHRLLHQPETKEMTPVKDQIAVEDHRSSGDSKTPDHA